MKKNLNLRFKFLIIEINIISKQMLNKCDILIKFTAVSSSLLKN